MGCDIHAYVEEKIDGGWHMIDRVTGTAARRDYEFFTHLCGVRASDYQSWPEPKGLPEDVSVVCRHHSDRWDSDGHSHSWETYTEFLEKKLALERLRNNKPYEYELIGVELYEDQNPNDFRVVFWFDN